MWAESMLGMLSGAVIFCRSRRVSKDVSETWIVSKCFISDIDLPKGSM